MGARHGRRNRIHHCSFHRSQTLTRSARLIFLESERPQWEIFNHLHNIALKIVSRYGVLAALSTDGSLMLHLESTDAWGWERRKMSPSQFPQLRPNAAQTSGCFFLSSFWSLKTFTVSHLTERLRYFFKKKEKLKAESWKVQSQKSLISFSFRDARAVRGVDETALWSEWWWWCSSETSVLSST